MRVIVLAMLMLFAVAAQAAPEAAPAGEPHGRVAPHHTDVGADAQAPYPDEYHGDEGGANVFAGTLAQSIAALIVFLTLLALLTRYAWGPILSGLQDREKKIADDLSAADRSRSDAQRTLDEYKKQLADARVEAQKIMDQARGEAEKAAASIKTDAEREINVMKERAQRDIAGAREDALTEIYARTAMLSTEIAGRILHREIRPEDQQDLVDESLRELRTRN